MSKKKGKKKGGKKGGGNDDDISDADKIHMLEVQAEALKLRLITEQEKADKAKASENEVRAKLFDLENQYKMEEDKRQQIIAEMTRQYKSMQDELMKENSELRKLVKDQEEVIKSKEQALSDLSKEREIDIMRKDEEIRDLKRKIEDMSSEFARMLKETLDKMQDRIEMAQWDNDNADPKSNKRQTENLAS